MLNFVDVRFESCFQELRDVRTEIDLSPEIYVYHCIRQHQKKKKCLNNTTRVGLVARLFRLVEC